MQWLSFPHGWHPYQELFARALAPSGVRYVTNEPFTNAALAASPDVDGIHFQWVENLWDTPSFWQRARSVYGFRKYCQLAKRLGKRIVWTVHNHGRHEGETRVGRLGFRTVAAFADLIIVHSQWSGDYIRRSFRPAGAVVKMPLGNFDGVYPTGSEAAETRAALGLDPTRPVCGLVGGMRPYRGHELAIAAARAAGGRWQLLIAGNPIDPTYGQRLAASVSGASDITLKIGKLSDRDYADCVRACDIILLPYSDITGSAALLSAWTLARPVVTSDLPFFREYLPSDQAAGTMTRDGTAQELSAAIDRLLAVPSLQRVEAARAAANTFAWDSVVKPVTAVIQGWSQGRRN